jgi:DNA-binding NarL/FixJ family response regulator
MPANTKPDPATESAQDDVRLTRREVEVLILVTEGRSSRQVADELFISKRTVDFHLENLYGKLEVRNRSQAFYEAVRRGLIAVEPGTKFTMTAR